MRGNLETIVGAMFAGKTSELLKRILWAKHQNKKIIVIIVLNTVPIKTPIKDPNAGKNDFVIFLFDIISPVNAPMKGPKIRPSGPIKNKPKIRPIVAPN